MFSSERILCDVHHEGQITQPLAITEFHVALHLHESFHFFPQFVKPCEHTCATHPLHLTMVNQIAVLQLELM